MMTTRLRLGVVCTYPPGRDGEAAFAGELVRELSGDCDVVVCAVDRHRTSYPDEVAAVVHADDVGDFRRAADILTGRRVDAVLVRDQGWAGTHHLLDELRRNAVPCLVALPAVRRDGALRTLAALAAGSSRVLVRSGGAGHLVRTIAGGSVRVVPTGVPLGAGGADGTAVRPAVREAVPPGRRIIATVGRIRPDRGLETAITALPGLVRTHPELRYVIGGPVDPDAEPYRDFLRDLIVDLELTDHVSLLDADLSAPEQGLLLDRAAIHVVPRIEPDRTCCTTLVRGVVAGCATVAGAHPYSAELLADGAGLLVRPGDVTGLATAVAGLLEDESRLIAARRAARAGGGRFTATAAADRIVGFVREVVRPRLVQLLAPPLRLDVTPPTTDVGLAQLAVVAGGLLDLPVELLPHSGWATAAGWAAAAVPRLADLPEELAGRALWGLGGVVASTGVPEAVRSRADLARPWYARSVPADLTELAFVVLGLVARLPEERSSPKEDLRPPGSVARLPEERSSPKEDLRPSGLARDPDPGGRLALRCAVSRLNAAWSAADKGWPWFTGRIGAEGARLPQALIAGGRRLDDDTLVERGIEALDWYARRTGTGLERPHVAVAGSDPTVEVGAIVEAYVEAFRATGSAHLARAAGRCFEWFERGEGRAGVAYLGALLALRAADLLVLPTAEPTQGDLVPAA